MEGKRSIAVSILSIGKFGHVEPPLNWGRDRNACFSASSSAYCASPAKRTCCPLFQTPFSWPLAGFARSCPAVPECVVFKHRLCDGVLFLVCPEGRRIEFPEFGEVNFAVARLGDG